MKTSDAGVEFIKTHEGLRLRAYQDSVGVWTIGYGHTGKDVVEGLTINEEEAETLLKEDLARFERGVVRAVAVDINQNQFDSLVSFSFNLGLSSLRGSTLLRKLNRGDTAEASREFTRWVYAGGKKLRGLVTRRLNEQSMFLS